MELVKEGIDTLRFGIPNEVEAIGHLNVVKSMLFRLGIDYETNTINNQKIVTKFFYFDPKKQKRIGIIDVEVNLEKTKFGYGSIKIHGLFNRVMQKHNPKLYTVWKYLMRLPFKYLSRVDYFFDFNGKIKDFLKVSGINYFKTGSIIGGLVSNKGNVAIQETATIYRGNTNGRRVVARLYNKWVDTINKGKLDYYEYITEETKRLEVEIEVEELREQKKIFTGKTVREFIDFIKKQVILKKRQGVKKFDVEFVRLGKIRIFLIPKKYKKEQDSLKIKLRRARNKRAIQDLGNKDFSNYITQLREDYAKF